MDRVTILRELYNELMSFSRISITNLNEDRSNSLNNYAVSRTIETISIIGENEILILNENIINSLSVEKYNLQKNMYRGLLSVVSNEDLYTIAKNNIELFNQKELGKF